MLRLVYKQTAYLSFFAPRHRWFFPLFAHLCLHSPSTPPTFFSLSPSTPVAPAGQSPGLCVDASGSTSKYRTQQHDTAGGGEDERDCRGWHKWKEASFNSSLYLKLLETKPSVDICMSYVISLVTSVHSQQQ